MWISTQVRLKTWKKKCIRLWNVWIKFCNKSTPGVNYTNILQAGFISLGKCWTYWHTVQGIQGRSWAYLLVGRNREVGCNFVGETERRWRIPTGAFALWARRLVKLTPAVVPYFTSKPSKSLKYHFLAK